MVNVGAGVPTAPTEFFPASGAKESTTVSPEYGSDGYAAWYDQAQATHSLVDDVIMPRMLPLIAPLEGRIICDLSCGSGRLSRRLAQRGAVITGVDSALSLLELARFREAEFPLGISYLQTEATTLEALPRHAFDGAVSHMALMHIDDLKAAFFSVGEVLRPGGWFVFSITHPCFQTPRAGWGRLEDGSVCRQISDYFDEGAWLNGVEGQRAPAGGQHRTLSTYVNMLVQTGFQLEQLVEPQATVAAAARMPGYTNVPAYMLFKARRLSDAA